MTSPEPDPQFLRKAEQPEQLRTPPQPSAQLPPQPPSPPQQQTWGAAPPVPLRPDEERTWAILAHVLPLVVGGFLPPLIIWLAFRGRGAYLEDQAKEALNFQLTLLIAYVIGFVTVFILVGFVILAAAGIGALVFAILAAVASSRYEWYRYPLTIRFVK
ncbi:DUF4870 domain-containing protein [Cellulomonas sp. PhB150]|uniref:DUF4870 domain-containing protein n=1 Tax=Cellulomonas sp. PhB150 TaxID=2485188 RepID=UPI000F4724E3|nr:DUF4870 domain-containing protein [Cellulomonas sp. PhB150]ROS31046.1 hypothetical protein EDF34_0697 [Cellulomonas sp. PhB150]